MMSEKVAIKAYSEISYGAVNRYLRKGELPNSEAERYKVNAILEGVDNAMSRTALKSPVIVHRGLCESPKCVKFFTGLKVGAEFEDKGFVSTSVRPIAELKEKVNLQILVPAGKQGFYMGELSRYTQDEAEFLLPRGSKFRVLETVSDGGTTLLKVVVL